MSESTVVTPDLFKLCMAGCGNHHFFISHKEIIEGFLEKKVEGAERDYGINAWHRNIGAITTPVSKDDVVRFRAIARRAGYRAYISNEELLYGGGTSCVTIEFCEIVLVRVDVAQCVTG